MLVPAPIPYNYSNYVTIRTVHYKTHGIDSLAWPDPFRAQGGRLSSLIDNALREKGSGHARLWYSVMQPSKHYWLANFISRRLQRVVLGGTPSPYIPVSSGVPQGTVLHSPWQGPWSHSFSNIVYQ